MPSSWIFAVALVVTVIVYSSPSAATLSVFACEPEWKALVEEVGGNNVKVYSATTGMQDPHYIEARPSLIAKARSADLLICTGAELEVGWLPVVQRRSGNSGIQNGAKGAFFAAEYVERLEIPESVDRSQGDVHASGNPHIHLDPYRLKSIAGDIRDWLEAADPGNSESYQQGWKRFDERWQAAISQWEQRLSTARGTRVITHHRAWPYLFEWLDWKSVGELEPLPGVPPTAKHLAKLVEEADQSSPSMIIIASYQDPRGAEWLSERIDIPVVILPSTIGGAANSEDLFQFFEVVTERLAKALKVEN